MALRIIAALVFSVTALIGANDTHASQKDPQAQGASAIGEESLNWVDFGHKENPSLVAMFINFVLLVIVLYFALRKPVSKAVKGRKEDMENAIKEAKALEEEAKKALAEARKKIEVLDSTILELRKEIISSGESEADRILKDAQSRSERMRNDTKALIEQETAQILQDLRDEVAGEVVEAATRLLRENLVDADQEKLAEEYLSAVEDRVSSDEGR